MPAGGTVHVVATLNATQGTGQLRHVTPIAAAAVGQAPLPKGGGRTRGGGAGGHDARLRVYGAGEKLLGEYPAPWIQDSCRDPGDDDTGSIDVFVPGAASATKLELVFNGTVVDTFTPAPTPKAVSNIRGSAPARGARRGATRAAGGPGAADEVADADPVLTWTAPAAPATRARRGAARSGPAGAAEAPGAPTQYTVQISVDGGKTWQTVGYALKEPQVRIDRTVLGDADTVKVRITATSGFKSVTTEKTMKASDL